MMNDDKTISFPYINNEFPLHPGIEKIEDGTASQNLRFYYGSPYWIFEGKKAQTFTAWAARYITNRLFVPFFQVFYAVRFAHTKNSIAFVFAKCSTL